MRQVAASSLLGQGIYGSRQIARLLRAHLDLVARWTTSRAQKPALIEPSQGDLFTFHDLISLLVVKELHDRGVTTDEIREGVQYLAKALNTERPLAHQGLATVDRGFYAKLDSETGAGAWYHAGRGGQGAFELIIKPHLRPIEYDETRMASLWRPHERVWINPRVQAGTPCIDATRIPTEVLAAMAKAEDPEDLADLADEYEIELADVTAALDYEAQLAAAA